MFFFPYFVQDNPDLTYISSQAFKIVVTDPDTVLNSLTREVQEVGPDGQEVNFIFIR